MAARDIRKQLSLFVDGRGYAGQLEEFNAPKLTQKTEDVRLGGMVGPVKVSMGMEPLDADFSLIAYDADVLALWGVTDGAEVQFTAREALESFDGTVTAVAHQMRGKITEIDPGTSKAGDKPSLKVTLSLSYYKLQHGARTVQEIDLINMIHVVEGNDKLAAIRAALAM